VESSSSKFANSNTSRSIRGVGHSHRTADAAETKNSSSEDVTNRENVEICKEIVTVSGTESERRQDIHVFVSQTHVSSNDVSSECSTFDEQVSVVRDAVSEEQVSFSHDATPEAEEQVSLAHNTTPEAEESDSPDVPAEAEEQDSPGVPAEAEEQDSPGVPAEAEEPDSPDVPAEAEEQDSTGVPAEAEE
jgi:hypothetical protein